MRWKNEKQIRLIDADQLRKDVLDLPNCYNGFSDAYDKACIIDLIDDQPTVEPHWIPCSERLPNSQTEVIVSCRDDSADTIYRYTTSGWITTNGEYWIIDNEINPYVVAWMPLPEPYRGEQE